MKFTCFILLSFLTNILCASAENGSFNVVSFDAFPDPNAQERNLVKFQFVYKGKEDHAIVDPTDSAIWVVFFHSFGGDALELYKSPLLHPQWIEAIKASGFGLISFETYGNSWMSPFTADAIHLAIDAIRKKYHVKRFIFVGASMGGSGVLTYCVRYPSDVFAALAMCPASDIESYYAGIRNKVDPTSVAITNSIERSFGENSEAKKDGFSLSSVQRNATKLTMPLVIAHGGADPLIPVSQSDSLSSLLNDKADFRYFRYPDGDHFYPSIQGFKDSWPWLIELIKQRSDS